MRWWWGNLIAAVPDGAAARDPAHNYETHWAQNAYHSVESGAKALRSGSPEGPLMLKFLLWCILLVLCWPLALLALVLTRLFGCSCCRFVSSASPWTVCSN